MSYKENVQVSDSKQLSQHTTAFLLHGASCTGSFIEGLNMIEEELFISEPWELLQDFCEWLDLEIGGGGRANIQQLWRAFQNPTDPIHEKFIAETQKIMLKYKNL